MVAKRQPRQHQRHERRDRRQPSNKPIPSLIICIIATRDAGRMRIRDATRPAVVIASLGNAARTLVALRIFQQRQRNGPYVVFGSTSDSGVTRGGFGSFARAIGAHFSGG